MTSEFGMASDSSQDNNEHMNDRIESPVSSQFTADELSALVKRDANAQKHIPRLEAENSELRTRVLELESKLENAKTLDDVLERLNNKSDGSTPTKEIDPDKVAELVVSTVKNLTKEQKEEQNWSTVLNKLNDTYGSFSKADAAIAKKAAELGLTTKYATSLAKTSPEAFFKLFMDQSTNPLQQTTNSATSVPAANVGVGKPDNKEELRKYYQKMRRENPNKYWKLETQMQYRKDMGFAD